MQPADCRRAADSDVEQAGVQDAPIEVVDYDPAWPGAYAAECRRLMAFLPGAELHHFGSTAVPGLAAKPVIDMITLVVDLDAPIPTLVSDAGYLYPDDLNATLTHRRFLCYPSVSHRTHHLHLVDKDEELERRLRFRDRLRGDPTLARDYVRLKRVLAERHWDNRDAYTEAKSEFIQTTLRRHPTR